MESASEVPDLLRRQQKKKIPARRSATPRTEPTTAPAIVPLDTLCFVAFSWSAPGLATIGVLVTVWVTGAPDIVSTWVLTSVVRVPLTGDDAAVVAAMKRDVEALDVVVGEGVDEEDVELEDSDVVDAWLDEDYGEKSVTVILVSAC